MASVILRTFLLATVSSNVFCESINPITLFLECRINIIFVGASTSAVAIMGTVFGYYIIRLKTFNDIFPKIMKTDFIVTAMYFGGTFTAPSLIASKVMVGLFGTHGYLVRSLHLLTRKRLR